jgi:hypothetical protein
MPLSKPPEGAIVGESVPRENEREDWRETEIERIAAALKQRGGPFASMSDAELRDRAIERLEKLREHNGK